MLNIQKTILQGDVKRQTTMKRVMAKYILRKSTISEDLSPSQHTSSSLVFSLFFSFHLLKIFLFRSFCLIFRLPSDHPICDHFFDFLPSSCELCVCLHSRVSSHHPRRSHPSSKSPTRIQNNVRLISLLHFNVAECLLNCYKARAMLCAPCPRLLCAHPPKAQTHFIFIFFNQDGLRCCPQRSA